MKNAEDFEMGSRRRLKVTIVRDEVRMRGLTLGDLIGMLESLRDVEVEIEVASSS